MRKLSECAQPRAGRYAKCPNCREVFIDDLMFMGVVFCPACQGSWSLIRDMTDRDFELAEMLACAVDQMDE